jgi:hypothetical protein
MATLKTAKMLLQSPEDALEAEEKAEEYDFGLNIGRRYETR